MWDEQPWMKTVTVVERTKEDPTPTLYRADGTPLAPAPQKIGFAPPAPPSPIRRGE